MKILLNDRVEEFESDSISVTEMLILKKYSYKLRIIKINGVLIPREEYDSTLINEGDVVHMLYLMSGG
jgi:thiamine biosynthesis protein ThiS